MRQIVSGIGLRRTDIFKREVRIILQYVLDTIPGRQIAQDMLDRDARAGDHGLAHHDGRVALDTGMGHGRIRSIEVQGRHL